MTGYAIDHLPLQTLTEYERVGLESSSVNLADGHAYHDLTAGQRRVIERLPEIWTESGSRTQPAAERAYLDVFCDLAGAESLRDHRHFCICPTASNSIDIVGAHLVERELRTALVEPTFDNLALLLARRRVQLVAFDEATIYAGRDLDPATYDAIFLVNPNNPTGRPLGQARFEEIVEHCLRHDKLLLLDNSFRFFVAQDHDPYALLLASGVSFIAIEDTGKVWPTQDLKASVMIFSADVAQSVRRIYEEIYLCMSNFALGLIGAFIQETTARGLEASVWSEVASRRERFRMALCGTGLVIAPQAAASRLSVEWVDIRARWPDDLAAVEALAQWGINALPGRFFYWQHGGGPGTTDYVRFSLLRQRADFERALQLLTVQGGHGGAG